MPTIIRSDPRAREKPCLRCGYSLRKLTDSTHCPECGLSVWLSLNQNDTLEWSNPSWLRSLSRGALIMLGAQVLALLAYVLFAAYHLPQIQYEMRRDQAIRQASYDPVTFMSVIQSIGNPPSLQHGLMRSAILTAAAFLILNHGGLFLLVSNERRYPDRLREWRLAAWIICALAGLVSLLMILWAISPLALGFFSIALKLVAIASAVITWGYLRHLARRAAHSALARTCTWLMLVPLLSFLKVFPWFGLYLVARFSWLLDLIPLIYIPLAAILLGCFARLFSNAAVAAQAHWMSETRKDG